MATALIAGGATVTQAATPSPTNSTHNAAAWLAKQNPGTAGGPLTSSIIALTASGVGKTKTQQWLSTLEANIDSFIADGPGQVGSLGKSIYAVEVQGGNAASFGGHNMPEELEALMVEDGANKGRFQVDATDYSSGLTQAWAVLGLARLDEVVPADAISYLLGLQCPNGGFAAAYNAGPDWTPGQYHGTCESDDEVDVDTTSMALQAMATPRVSGADGVESSTSKAADYLVSIQNSNGSFSDPWFGPNANTTGLAAQALRAAGKSAQANKATSWLNLMQLTCANATTAAAVKQVGAVAYNAEALAKAKKSGISGGDFVQWTMAAQQAIGGMSGASTLVTASAADQGAGLPTANCKPVKVAVKSAKSNSKGTVKVKLGANKGSTWVGKAVTYKYKVRKANKKWTSWKTTSANRTSLTISRSVAGSPKYKGKKRTRYVQLLAYNAAGRSTTVTKVRIK